MVFSDDSVTSDLALCVIVPKSGSDEAFVQNTWVWTTVNIDVSADVHVDKNGLVPEAAQISHLDTDNEDWLIVATDTCIDEMSEFEISWLYSAWFETIEADGVPTIDMFTDLIIYSNIWYCPWRRIATEVEIRGEQREFELSSQEAFIVVESYRVAAICNTILPLRQVSAPSVFQSLITMDIDKLTEKWTKIATDLDERWFHRDQHFMQHHISDNSRVTAGSGGERLKSVCGGEPDTDVKDCTYIGHHVLIIDH
ncbi:hypothetical protein BLNAU_3291 [Blattamonas nauphoetae]|uniref:Uncharacterized protein n=1 Tax=Blattamonas nauphoetae TaxID=2049346 RepID=A0ABQ9YDP9_9EUKA|nr:hypothetical protein BLNAU_3291 [Blattamonas nauphoetae]